MFTAFENCKSIEEVANNAARFERMNLKREYTKNSNEIFSIPTTYEFYYENSEMKLLEDVITYVEYTKKQWEKEKKKKESREKNNYFVRKLDRKLVDDGIDHIATVSHYILRVARKISEQTQMPTFIIYNAKEYYGAILCGRHALLSAVAGINAKNGFLNINTEKWAMNLFQRSVNISQNEVLELLFGEMRPQREDVKRIIILVQNILNRQLDFLGKKHWINKEEYDMLDESQDILIQI